MKAFRIEVISMQAGIFSIRGGQPSQLFFLRLLGFELTSRACTSERLTSKLRPLCN